MIYNYLCNQYISQRLSYKRQELFILSEFTTEFFGRACVAHFFAFCVVILYVFTIWVPCCDISYDFCIKTMLGLSKPPVVCTRTHIFFLCYLYLFVHSGVQYILCCDFVLFFFVLCTLCCQFLWIVHFWLPLLHSLTFIL